MTDDTLGILRLGDPRLREGGRPVGDVQQPSFRAVAARLHDALDLFRARNGFGRAIAAAQLGIPLRCIALHYDGERRTLADPEITERRPETFTLWDDCLSFPDLLVRVRRHIEISILFTNERGERESWPRLDRARSELLQHEIDHLDGILAVDRALDPGSIVPRATFAERPAHFAAMVDG